MRVIRGSCYRGESTAKSRCMPSRPFQVLADHVWPGAVEVRVRIGIHSGEAAMAAPGWLGFSVHRAARVAGVGYGGQVFAVVRGT